MNYAKHIGKYIVAETNDHEIFRGDLIDYLTKDENDIESIIISQTTDGTLIELPICDLISIDIGN